MIIRKIESIERAEIYNIHGYGRVYSFHSSLPLIPSVVPTVEFPILEIGKAKKFALFTLSLSKVVGLSQSDS